MYFIVTGIQFWMTSYLIEILGNDPIIVMLSFAITSITAPLGGVIVGGTFADRYGGYKGKNSLKALKLCSAFGVVSFVFSFPLGFLYSIEYITVLLWAFLFFGAAIVPIGTGIAVSAVRRYNYIYERDCQATSSSISQLIINLFGYFSSPILTGMIMDSFKDKHQGYKWGYNNNDVE
jgi:MFS family permease